MSGRQKGNGKHEFEAFMGCFDLRLIPMRARIAAAVVLFFVSSATNAGGQPPVGSSVLCRSTQNFQFWYLAKVTQSNPDGGVHVQYDNSPVEEDVAPDRYRVVAIGQPAARDKGDKVFCKDIKTTAWYQAEILQVHKIETFRVRFVDFKLAGDPQQTIEEDDIAADRLRSVVAVADRPQDVPQQPGVRPVADPPAKGPAEWPFAVQVQKLEWTPVTICTLVGCFAGIVLVVIGFQALRAEPGYDPNGDEGGSFLLFYKVWHFPAFCVANLINPPFLKLTGCFALSLVLVVGLTAGGYVGGGTVFGAAHTAIIGGVLCLALAVFFISPALNRAMVESEFREGLTIDMLSGRRTLQTVRRDWFLWWCFVQTVVLLGVSGSLVGQYLQNESVGIVPVAIISAFFAILIGQLIAYARKNGEGTPMGYSLAAVQLVIGGILFYPLKAVVADQQVGAGLVEALQGMTGTEFGPDMIFMGIGGVVVSLFNNFAFARTGETPTA
ncbi:MAG: hypothetical protein HYR84_04275 [Planctomycetes bacterium]|nr:hypothetical protein [Planctomycetota bacterium]